MSGKQADGTDPSLAQVSGKIAHDINNLLTVIALNIELANESLAPGHPAVGMLATALKAANASAELSATLLAASRKAKGEIAAAAQSATASR
jgi:hypothetical protein